MRRRHRKSTRAPLFWRLMAGIMVFWLFLLCTAMVVTMRYALQSLQTKINEVLQSTVRTVAQMPLAHQAVLQGSCPAELSEFLSNVVDGTEDLDYLTIADANAIQVYHMDPSFVGLPLEGGDEGRALAGERYFSDGGSPFGRQHRAFCPIRDDSGGVIGFVMASTSHTRLEQLRDQIYVTYVKMFLFLTVCTLLVSGVLAVYLGRHLRGAKPEDLLRVYLTQNDILNSLDEGLVSFDNTGRVRLVNAAAARMLGHREDLLLGRQVDDLLRAEDGGSLRSRGSHGIQSDRANILVHAVRLPDSNLWARQVLILVDKTEAMRQAQELGGTRHIINALRANTHEFMNKLQVISGLLQMGRTDEALGYIGSLSALHEQIISPVMQLIRNPSVAALILGKQGNMRELGVSLTLLNNSLLPEHSRYLSTDELVTVVGNLLENAMEAVNAAPAGGIRSVVLQITEDEKGLFVMVSDTGEGIADGDLPHIYETGYSTKAPTGRGVGMKLVKDIVDRRGGSIDVDTEPGSGTTFAMIFGRERGDSL